MTVMAATPDARRSNIAGVVFALLAAGIGGAMQVYVGHAVQVVDPIVVLVEVSLLIIVVFNAAQLRDPRRYLALVKRNARDVVYINVFTLIAWVGSFAALRFIEPALSNSASVGLEPIATLALTVVLWRERATILRSDVIAAIAMLAIAIVQVAAIWGGLSGMGQTGGESVGIGVACLVANGVANGALTVVPKRLFDGEMTRSQILACRMFLLFIAGLLYLWIARPHVAFHDDLLVVVVTFVAVTGSIYLVQAAIQFAEPVTVSFIISLNPLVVLALQAFDPRLAFSLMTLITTIAMVGLVVWSTLEQVRARR